MSQDLQARYQLGPATAATGGWLHRARHRADPARPAAVHRLTALAPVVRDDVRQRLAELAPADRAAVLDLADVDGVLTVVTEPLPDDLGLLDWLAQRRRALEEAPASSEGVARQAHDADAAETAARFARLSLPGAPRPRPRAGSVTAQFVQYFGGDASARTDGGAAAAGGVGSVPTVARAPAPRFGGATGQFTLPASPLPPAGAPPPPSGGRRASDPSVTGGGAPLFGARPTAPVPPPAGREPGSATHALAALGAEAPTWGGTDGPPFTDVDALHDDDDPEDLDEFDDLDRLDEAAPPSPSAADRVHELQRRLGTGRARAEGVQGRFAAVAAAPVVPLIAGADADGSGVEPPRLLPLLAILGAALVAGAGLVLFVVGR